MPDTQTISADYTLRPSELAETLALLVEARQPCIVWGPPGSAKSQIGPASPVESAFAPQFDFDQPGAELGRESVNALTFTLEQSMGAGQAGVDIAIGHARSTRANAPILRSLLHSPQYK